MNYLPDGASGLETVAAEAIVEKQRLLRELLSRDLSPEDRERHEAALRDAVRQLLSLRSSVNSRSWK